MSEKIVAKLRSGFITDACGVPLRGSTEKIMDEAADLLEQQAKELDRLQAAWDASYQQAMKNGEAAQEAQARVVVLEERERMRLAGISTAAYGYWKEEDSIHPDYDTVALRDVAQLYLKYAALASTDTAAAIEQKVREKESRSINENSLLRPAVTVDVTELSPLQRPNKSQGIA